MKFSAETTYLPSVRNNNDGRSIIFIRNLGDDTAKVTVNWYFRGGGKYAHWDYSTPMNGRTTVVTPSGFEGSAVVVSNRDVSIAVLEEAAEQISAYTGITEANWNTGWGQPGTEIFAPVAMGNSWGKSYQTEMYVHNTTGTTVNPTIEYCKRNAGTCHSVSFQKAQIPPFGTIVTTPQDAWGEPFFGSAHISSEQPLAVVVLQTKDNPLASYYNAFSSGAEIVYLPSLMNRWGENWNPPQSWTSSFTIQNVGQETLTELIIGLYGRGDHADFHYVRHNVDLAPQMSRIVYQGDPNSLAPVPVGWHGAAIITASQPIAIIVNQEDRTVEQVPLNQQSYSGFVGGGSFLYAPFVGSHAQYYGKCYDSCTEAQNVGASSTEISTVDSYFYSSGTSLPGSGSSIDNVLAGRVETFFVPSEVGGITFNGSLRVSGPASCIAGIHSIARLKNCGTERDDGDYGASHNMPPR